ncbi:MAG: hypothetical protein ACI4JN_06635 [Ruminococcus sp.]
MNTMKKESGKEGTFVYMEIYGVNRVIYRVTSSVIKRMGKAAVVYGVSLEDIRTGEQECIENFSDKIENALDFAEMLIQQKIPPYRLYSEALRNLRFSQKLRFSLK